MPDFENEEFLARLKNAQGWMGSKGLDAVFLSTEPEIRYYTGFRTSFWQSPTRPWYVVLPQSGLPIAVIPAIGAALMAETFVKEIKSWSSPEQSRDGLDLLIETLAPFDRVGMMMGPQTAARMPVQDLNELSQTTDFQDCSQEILMQRAVKSDAEIAKIGRICAIASNAFAAVPDWLQAGMTHASLFRKFRIELLAAGAEEVPYLVGGAGQGGYADVISPPAGQILENGDIVMLDTGSSLEGYFCDFDRNFAIGAPSNEAQSAHQKLWDATEAGLQAAKPGASFADLFTAMSNVLGGSSDIGRLGHGLGTELTEWPSIIGWQDVELKENMVITLEPSIGLSNDKMLVAEENIVITNGAPKLLSTRVSRDLVVI